MDLQRVKQLRRSLTLHFAVIAVLTAMLVATGSGSLFLPVFIFLVSLSAFIFVDTLEWFELGRVGSYIGMIAATSAAIASYVYSTVYAQSQSGQLMAVAGLLVYPEAVLFLQQKNLRIFEQLAVFLLLEMIVAALVNDNLLFGVLLMPIMVLWVSSLFLFSRYATLVNVDASIERPLPKMAEVLFKKFMKTVMGESKPVTVVTSKFLPSEQVQSSRLIRRATQSIPIGIGALVFAGLFFYLLPRTATSTFQSGLGNENRIGLPSRLTFGAVGKILQNRTPVMRVSLTDPASGKLYETGTMGPYLRALVFEKYGADPGRSFTERGEWQSANSIRYQSLEANDAARNLTRFGRDFVHIEFDLRSQFSNSMFSVPPVCGTSTQQSVPLNYDDVQMLMQNLDETSRGNGSSVLYTIGSLAFGDNMQSPVTPANFLARRGSRPNPTRATELENMLAGFADFSLLDDYRRKLITQLGMDPDNISDPARLASELERHLAESGEFGYSLDLRLPSDAALDPIEDFVVNQKEGHCQYFASALVAMLRQSGIPSRVVVGYHPREFNKLGGYFLVRQSDAHAWTEALMSRESLVGSKYEKWLTDSPLYWVRLDATPGEPGSSGEIVDQRGQAIDYAEKLWKEYVVEGQKLNGKNSLYAPVAENGEDAYAGLVSQFKKLQQSLKDGKFLRAGGIGATGSLVVLAIGLVLAAVALWQFVSLLPRIAPKLAGRLGFARSELDARHAFFARCLRLIERLGVRRQSHETPLEFTQGALPILSAHEPSSENRLSYLTHLYYRLRFSDVQQMSSEEKARVDEELKRLERSIEQSKAANRNAKQSS